MGLSMDIRDSICVVTGASSGIGKQTAIDLAADGATVCVVARREELLQELVEELSGAHSGGPPEKSGAHSGGPPEKSGAHSGGPPEKSGAHSGGPPEKSGAHSGGPPEKSGAPPHSYVTADVSERSEVQRLAATVEER